MNSIEKTAKTVEEAIQAALDELDIDRDDAVIEIIDEGSKGFLGIGGKDAHVRVSEADYSAMTNTDELSEQDGKPAEYAKDFVKGIMERMGVSGTVNAKMGDEMLELVMEGDDSGILIGRRGETLNAMQYLTSLAVNRHFDDYVRVSLDTENYKQKREETLKALARKLASNAVKYRRNVTLEPMNPYERRIIHSALQGDEMINTYSTGEEPNRKVVIVYKGIKR